MGWIKRHSESSRCVTSQCHRCDKSTGNRQARSVPVVWHCSQSSACLQRTCPNIGSGWKQTFHKPTNISLELLPVLVLRLKKKRASITFIVAGDRHLNWILKNLKTKMIHTIPPVFVICLSYASTFLIWKFSWMNENESIQWTAYVCLISRSRSSSDHHLWQCKMQNKCLAYQWLVLVRYLWGWQSCLCVCRVVCYRELKVLLRWPLTRIRGSRCLKQGRRYIPLTVRWWPFLLTPSTSSSSSKQ